MNGVRELYLCVAICFAVVIHSLPIDTNSLCQDVLKLDCMNNYVTHEDETVCGTNDVTYLNKCLLVQARCQNTTLDRAYDGPCIQPNLMEGKKDDISPTSEILTRITSSEPPILYENICSNPDNVSCPEVLDPLCGTNDKFYLNACQFYKERCYNKDLQLQALSNCKQ